MGSFPVAVLRWLLCQPCERAVKEDRRRRRTRDGGRESAAGRAGEGPACRRRCEAGGTGEGGCGGKGSRKCPHRRREGQADRAGQGRCRRTGAGGCGESRGREEGAACSIVVTSRQVRT